MRLFELQQQQRPSIKRFDVDDGCANFAALNGAIYTGMRMAVQDHFRWIDDSINSVIHIGIASFRTAWMRNPLGALFSEHDYDVNELMLWLIFKLHKRWDNEYWEHTHVHYRKFSKSSRHAMDNDEIKGRHLY